MYKKKIGYHTLIAGIIAAFGFTHNAFAALPGFYLGAQVGDGFTHYGVNDINTIRSASSVSSEGIAGRVYGGYQFTPNWGGELGYLQFSNIKFYNINGGTASNQIKQSAVDLFVKGTYPLPRCFSVNGKLGVALVSARHDSLLGGDENKLLPAVGLGASYDLLCDIPVDVSYEHIFQVGGRIPSADFVAFGLSYYFG